MSLSGLRSLRERAGLTQGALAAGAGISRQTLNAIEAGRTDPAVSIALRLAGALGCRVEELFEIPPTLKHLEAVLTSTSPRPGRVSLVHVGTRWVAHPLSTVGVDTVSLSADGIAVPGAREGKVRVELLRPEAEARETVLVLGCAPALGLLVDRLNTRRGPGRFVWLQQSSTAALDALAAGHAHVAGIHLRDDPNGEANLAAVRRRQRGKRLALITLASWQAGLVVAKGNPLDLRGVADLGRPGLRFAAREAGSGARVLLDQLLTAARLSPRRALKHARQVATPLEVGQAVALGLADVGLAMLPVALAYGLSFVPLAEERFDLVVPSDSLADPRLIRLLDAMNGAPFRRELASVGGYDVSHCGRAVGAP